ncbi:unnamed protein product [Euphydryas editha]|uniref:Uncharacterized protein n=1 Tax=Euphydryas editha TaxID=104508 RepID=A0AAU9U4P5_EUPED|nr:unnamed protein product [Euphydryas editha]
MEWKLFGPIILAVVLFLLVGTIFERRIEAAIRRIIEHQQAYLLANRINPQDTISIQSPSIRSPSTEDSQKSRPPTQNSTNIRSTSVPQLKTLKYTVSILSTRKSFPQMKF